MDPLKHWRTDEMEQLNWRLNVTQSPSRPVTQPPSEGAPFFARRCSGQLANHAKSRYSSRDSRDCALSDV